MRIFSEKYRLLAWLSLILVIGFVSTSAVSYISSRNAILHNISEQTLPLTGDNIYSEIQKDILRPVFISSVMAQDTFVRDWLLNGEQDESQVRRYLSEVTQKYNTITSFLVSNRTGRYYYGKGILKTVSENEPRDVWFYRVRGMTAPYETNVDPDLANRDTMTIFVNYRVLDYHGNFIGVTGVGLTLDTLNHLLDNYQERFRRRIYFVDTKGQIVLAGHAMQAQHVSIRDMPGVKDIASDILGNGATQLALDYHVDGHQVLVNARFIPELGWHLVVEQSESEETTRNERIFALNLVVAAGMTLLALLLVWLAINRYHRRLERLVTIDPLTGCLNRQAFDSVLRDAIAEAVRHQRPLSTVMFDIDHFKRINDAYGHLAGDEVLRQLGAATRAQLREGDVLVRWGGEEFLILMRDCEPDAATRAAEALRALIAARDFELDAETGRSTRITISLGIASHRAGDTADQLFARVDAALYRAKADGRNRLSVAD